MSRSPTRRRSLRDCVGLGLGFGLPPALAACSAGQALPDGARVLERAMPARREPIVAIARAASETESIAFAVRRATELLGGIGSVVRRGDRVLWPRPRGRAAR